jgi:hypothetical protein
VVVLDEDFTTPPANPAEFLVDGAVGDWRRSLGDTSTNPELSWEYWNGTGWWKLDVTLDETQNLKTSGALRFEVPADMAPTDWSGRTNHWIRARLTGGDYGREKVTVTTSPTATPGVTEQTIERSTAGIRAPSVVGLHISYSICDSVLPTFVLTQDSGSIRDQSDANRTDGAIVEAFVPLVSLAPARRRRTAAPQEPDCPPECDCPEQPRALDPAEASTEELNPPPPITPGTGRSVFLGFAAPLAGDTVNVLLMVARERSSEQDPFAPLAVEALIGNRFAPLVVKDGTRGLGETGILTLAFPDAPTQAELFGRSLRWLRLTPRAGAASGWSPSLRGAYVNAAWARATETLTRELLGSSEGAPNLTVKLARPPVLADSLVLRVKEPLGEEARQALLAENPQSVLTDVPELPGQWVLWEQVVDPADEIPHAASLRSTRRRERSASAMDGMERFRRSAATRSSRYAISERSPPCRAPSTCRRTRWRRVPSSTSSRRSPASRLPSPRTTPPAVRRPSPTCASSASAWRSCATADVRSPRATSRTSPSRARRTSRRRVRSCAGGAPVSSW